MTASRKGTPRKALITVVMGFLVVAILTTQVHLHDGFIKDTKCTLCLHQANIDADLDASLQATLTFEHPAYIAVLSPQALSNIYIVPTARGPPTLLIG